MAPPSMFRPPELETVIKSFAPENSKSRVLPESRSREATVRFPTVVPGATLPPEATVTAPATDPVPPRTPVALTASGPDPVAEPVVLVTTKAPWLTVVPPV